MVKGFMDNVNNIIKKIGIDENKYNELLQKTKEQEQEIEKDILGLLYLMFKDILDDKNTFIYTMLKKEKDVEKKVYKLISFKNNKLYIDSLYNVFMERFILKSKLLSNDNIYKKLKEQLENLKINKDNGWVFFKRLIDEYFSKKIISSINYKIDLSRKEKLSFEILQNSESEKELVIITNKVYLSVEKEIFKFVKNNKKEYEKYINIYKDKIFPQFDTFLDIIIYNLFSKDRRHSFIYLNVKEGWGKTFIMKIFNELNIGIQTNLENLTKNPSPLTPDSFKNKVLLMIDEFTSFKKELKELNNSIILNPKNQKQVILELYTKLFVSKEKSESLSNLVDKQITDRIIYFNYTKNTDTLQNLVHLGIVDNHKMFKYLKYYIYIYFLKKIKFIKSLENVDINEYINRKIFEIHNNFKLKVEDPDKLIYDLFKSFVLTTLKNKLVIDNVEDYIETIDETYKNNDFTYNNTKFKIKGHYLYFNNLTEFRNFLINSVEEYDFKKLKYKINNIELYNVKKINNNIKFEGIPYKSYYMFDLRLLKNDNIKHKTYDELEEENEQLKKENLYLKEQLTKLKELEKENAELKEIINKNVDKQYILELETKLKRLEKENEDLYVKVKELEEEKKLQEIEITDEEIPF